MTRYAAKLGAIFYGLWGLLHIVGGAALLQQLTSEGTRGFLASVGSAVPVAALPQIPDGVAGAIFAYYAWQILWLGLLVLVVAVWLNWRNSNTGYWLNLVVVGAVDAGLTVFLLAPGYMAWSDGGLGLALWLPALVFSTIGRFNPASKRAGQAVLA